MKSFRRLIRHLINYLTSPAGLFQLAVVLLISGGATALFFEFRTIKRRVDSSFERSRKALSSDEIEFRIVPLGAVDGRGPTIIQSVADVRELAELGNSLFAATSGGLVQMTTDGREVRRYSVRDGLPESDLTALAVFRDRLYIGTSASGIVEFNGNAFRQIVIESRALKSVTAIFADRESLLVATSGAGLLEFDGARLTELKASATSLNHVVFVERRDGEIVAGTFADGLWIARSGRWRRFTTADGLPSNRVVGAVSVGSILFALTDRGLARADSANIDELKFSLVTALPAASGITLNEDKLLVVRDDGALFTAEPNAANPRAESAGSVGRSEFAGARFVSAGDALFIIGNRGAFRLGDGLNVRSFFEPADEPLAENTVAALAFDRDGNLWCGGFRRGVDVVSADGARTGRHAAAELEEVNSIVADDRRGMLVASNRGVTSLGDDFGPLAATSAALPSRAVAAAISTTGMKVFATARGLAIDDGRRIRVLTSVNGLPSNSVTSLLAARGAIYAGTTGGLAEIRDGEVVRVFRTSNSGLAHGWVTAIFASGNRILIGTFGGGVFELTESGAIVAVGDARFAVNPNALATADLTVYAGTPDGLRVLGPSDANWRRVTRGLPAPNVLAIAVRDGRVAFGTTGGIAIANGEFGASK